MGYAYKIQQQHDSSGQETGFYPWFQMPCGTSGTAGNGMTIQRDNEGITITGNKFENNKGVDIDEEPTGGQNDNTPKKIIIDHNIFTRTIPHEHSLEIMGKNGGATDQDYIITNNIIINGGIWMFICNNMTFSNNYVFGGTGYAFQGEKANSNIIFNNNIIINNNDDATKEGFYLSPHSSKTTKNIQITSNQFVNCALNFENCHDVMIVDNQISTRATNTYGIRILLNANPQDFQLTDYGQVIITGNNILLNTDDLQSEYRGIVFNNSNSYRVGIIKIDNNIIESKGSANPTIQYGILINNSPQYWDRLLIGKGNVFGSNIGNTIAVEKNSYLTGMNPTGDSWITEGNPNNSITALQGTTAIDKTRVADNKYQLNSINGNKGWTLLSEMGKQVLVEDEFIGTLPYPNPLQGHTPDITVFGSQWVDKIGQWNLLNSGEAVAIGGQNNMTVLDTSISNATLKAEFNVTNPGDGIGIAFRYWYDNTIIPNKDTYMRFYYKDSTHEIRLEKVVGNTITPIYQESNIVIGDSNIFILEVKMKDGFISLFFNGLLKKTVYYTFNFDKVQHGLFGKGATNYQICNSFKILL